MDQCPDPQQGLQSNPSSLVNRSSGDIDTQLFPFNKCSAFTRKHVKGCVSVVCSVHPKLKHRQILGQINGPCLCSVCTCGYRNQLQYCSSKASSILVTLSFGLISHDSVSFNSEKPAASKCLRHSSTAKQK